MAAEEDTHKEIASHFQRASRISPCVLVLDDVDALCQPRAHLREAMERFAVTLLLQHIDTLQQQQQQLDDEKSRVLLIATARESTSMGIH